MSSQVLWWFRRRAMMLLEPDVTSVAPDTWAYGSAAPITVQVLGINFDPSNATLQWDGTAVTPILKSSTAYSFSATAAMLGTAAGLHLITLTNPNGISSSKHLEVIRPVITSVSPTTASLLDTENIDVDGSGMTAESEICVNAVDYLATLYLDSGHVRTLNPYTFGAVGTLNITIYDRGAVSNGLPITVT